MDCQKRRQSGGIYLKKLKYLFILLFTLQTFSFAQDAGPKLETILGNEFSLIFTPLYAHDSDLLKKKSGLNLMPEFWDRIKFTLKYDNKVLWHSRVVVGAKRDAHYGFSGDSYSIKFDRSYVVYTPVDSIDLKAGMDTSWAIFPGAVSANNNSDHEVLTPLIKGGLGGRTSKRDIGGWLTYTPIKNKDMEISITPYILAPKTNFTTGIMSTLNAPERSGFDSAKYVTPLFVDDSSEWYRYLDSNKIPYAGLAIGGYFLDKSVYLAGSYETSFLASHSFFGTFNINKKEDWRSAAFLEGSANIGQYNVKRQTSLGLGLGYIGYFGPENRHEVKVSYVLNLENPNTDGRLYKTGHNYHFTADKNQLFDASQKTFPAELTGTSHLPGLGAVPASSVGTVTAQNPLGLDHPSFPIIGLGQRIPYTTHKQLKNAYYALHSIGVEGKFRVFSGDQLYFIVGANATLPGKGLGELKRVLADGTVTGERKLLAPISVSGIFSVNSNL